MYLSSPESPKSGEPAGPGLSLFSNPDSETKSCLVVNNIRSPSVPNHALKAFKLLSGSTEAQVMAELFLIDRISLRSEYCEFKSIAVFVLFILCLR